MSLADYFNMGRKSINTYGSKFPKWLFTKPGAENILDEAGNVISKAPNKVTQFAKKRLLWNPNSRPLTNLSKFGLYGLGGYELGKGLFNNNQATQGLTSGDINFVSPTSAIDKQTQQMTDLINQSYAFDPTKYDKLAQIYSALDVTGRDSLNKLQSDMTNGMSTMPTEADTAALKSYYQQAANTGEANNAANTGNILSGVIPTYGEAATAPQQTRDAGDIMATYLNNRTYMDRANMAANAADVSRYGQGFSGNMAAELQGAMLQDQMANDAARKQALSTMLANAQVEKLKARSERPTIPTNAELNQIGKEWNKLGPAVQKKFLETTLSPTELAKARLKMTDKQIYANIVLGTL